MKPTLLVTGPTGLIGSRLLERGVDGFNVVPARHDDGFDLLDPVSVRRWAETNFDEAIPDVIVHLAAFTDVSAAHEQTGEKAGVCYRLNVEGTRLIADLARKYGARLLHVSTDFVFDGKSESALSETDLPRPIEWYGETKFLAEKEVARMSDDFTILRIAFPYLRNPGVRPDFVNRVRQKLRAGETLKLFDDQIITPTFVDDICAAIGALARHPAPAQIFHVAGPESLSPYALGLKLARFEGASDDQLEKTSFREYLKIDPRPRQERLRLDTKRYRSFCEEHGTPLPKTVDEVFYSGKQSPSFAKSGDEIIG